MSSKLFISAGHSDQLGRDRGAAGNGLIEGIETVKIRTKVIQILKEKYGIHAIVDANNSILTETINFFRKLTNKDSILLDIHFNAGPPTATGVETFVADDANEKELNLAQALSVSLSSVLEIPLRGNFRKRRGVKSEVESQHKRLGWMRLAGNNILLELCFISNREDVEKYLRKFNLVCETIADQLAWALDAAPVAKVYVVKQGDSLWAVARSTGVTVERLRQLNGLKDNTLRIGQTLKLN
jgi:N-acetylmuramoyl-L-alanine amidase